MFSETSKASGHEQFSSIKCIDVRTGERLQVESAAVRIRQLAYSIRSAQPMGEVRRATVGFPSFAANWNDSSGCPSCFFGFHQYQGAPGWNGCFKKTGKQSIGKSRGGWNTKLHMVAASDRNAVSFELSGGNAHDAPEGRRLLKKRGKVRKGTLLLMDRAYEGDETRLLAIELGYTPVVPPKSNRKDPWEYDKRLYKSRNQVERLFRRIKRFRRIFTRYDKLDSLFLAFVLLALIFDNLVYVNRT